MKNKLAFSNKRSLKDMKKMIKCGKPVLELHLTSVKNIAYATVAASVWNIIYSIYLLNFAMSTRRDFGDFVNMISENDGNFLPLLLVLPGLLSIAVNATLLYLLYQAFTATSKPHLNLLMYAVILIAIVTIFIMVITCLVAIIRSSSSRKLILNGIIEAMKDYRSESLIKRKIDSLQIRFECCGSTQYKEWYDIEWYDTNLIEKQDNNNYKHQTPFSCCSIRSIYPCIHHNIEISHSAYKYSKEQNFSLSTTGCFKVVSQLKRQIGTAVAGRLVWLIVTQSSMVIGMRLLQTAHFTSVKLRCSKENYVCWLFGYYAEKKKETNPPPIPPIPKELMD